MEWSHTSQNLHFYILSVFISAKGLQSLNTRKQMIATTNLNWPGDTGQWIKVLATKPDNVSLITGSHMVGKNRLPEVVL